MANIVKFKKEQPQIKTIEKFSPDVIEFESKEEFAEYLDKHREKLEKETTQKLNKMFSINGYRITKIKGEISLRAHSAKSKPKVEPEPEPETKDESDTELESIKAHLQKLSQLYLELVKQLADIGVIKLLEPFPPFPEDNKPN